MSLAKLRQTGDTIVEVLICIAIIGTTLTISYGIGRRSQLNVREAEERGQFSQLAQQQLERFKEYLKINPTVHTDYPGDSGASPPCPALPDRSCNSILAQNGTSRDEVGFCFFYDYFGSFAPKGTLLIHYVIPGLGANQGPNDPSCAVNTAGRFYCEDFDCSAAPPTVGSVVDAAGYPYRAGVAYPPLLDKSLGLPVLPDQFYASAGLLEIGGLGTNAQGFDDVVIPYRIHQ